MRASLNKQIIMRTAASLVALTTYAVCGAAHSQEIRIGNIADQNGINADVSRDYLAGARTYFDYVNANGGINGRKLNVIAKDDGGEPANTLRLTRELIEKDKADVLFGFVGDEGLRSVAGDAVFKASGITLYAPLSGAEVDNSSGRIYFVRPTYREEAKHIVQHFSQLGNTTFAIIAADNPLGATLAGQLGDELKARGLPAATRLYLNIDLKNVEAISYLRRDGKLVQ